MNKDQMVIRIQITLQIEIEQKSGKKSGDPGRLCSSD